MIFSTGYSFLSEGAHTPMFTETGTPLHLSSADTAGIPAIIPEIVKDDIPSILIDTPSKMTPRCWKTFYNLLELYGDKPTFKTISQRFSIANEHPEKYKPMTPRQISRERHGSSSNFGIAIVGNVKIHRTRLLASLSGLKLEAEMTSLQISLSASKISQYSLAGHLGRTMLVLLEGNSPNQQYVLKLLYHSAPYILNIIFN